MSIVKREMFLKKDSFFKDFYEKLEKNILLFPFIKENVIIQVFKKDDIENIYDEISFLDISIQNFIQSSYSHFICFSYPNYDTKIYLASSSQTSFYKKDGIKILYYTLLLQNVFQKKITQIIYYYPTPFKKVFPKKKITLSPKEINSGVTFLEPLHLHHHKNGTIILFRKEEYLKVLIHELIHSFHLDYNIVKFGKKLESCICSNYPVLLNEAYTESFATLIYIFLITFHKKMNIKKLRKNIQIEILYEYRLAAKILDYYNIQINDLHHFVKEKKCLKLFDQKTNVFSYYLLKPLLLGNIDFYDNFMKKNLKNYILTKKGIKILENYILKTLLDTKSFYYNLLNTSKKHYSNSLKMVSF